jgi:flagellar biosynthesis/type III secretory pathway M-ring protein FliF/YscJ
VVQVLALLEKANRLIPIAENYVDTGKLIEAMETLEEVKNTLEEARFRLSIAKPVKPSVTTLLEQWPLLLLGLVVGVILSAIIMYFIARKSRKKLQERKVDWKDVDAKEKEKPPEEKLAPAPPVEEVSKEEASGILEALEKQFKEGKVSKKTYQEMKKRYSH